jgi:hypothetical protein
VGGPLRGGYAIFPIVPPETALFDTLMPVAMAFLASLYGYLHLSPDAHMDWRCANSKAAPEYSKAAQDILNGR